jgi:hypothetical protein
MATHHLPHPKPDRPFVSIGFVVAVLLAFLLALPFLTRHHTIAHRTFSSGGSSRQTQALAR